MSHLDVSIDTSHLKGLADLLERERSSGGNGGGGGTVVATAPAGGDQPIQDAINAAGLVFMGFIRDRYSRFSRGGGDWAPLAPSTLARRRKGVQTQGQRKASQTARILAAKGVAPLSAAILIDTSNLFQSLGNSAGGHAQEGIVGGIRVGTVVDYAEAHQFGDVPRMPAREIFVEPDQPTADTMGRALEIGYQRAIDQYGEEN